MRKSKACETLREYCRDPDHEDMKYNMYDACYVRMYISSTTFPLPQWNLDFALL